MDILENNFINLMESWKDLTTFASDYDLEKYLEKLEEFRGEVDSEIEVISRDLL